MSRGLGPTSISQQGNWKSRTDVPVSDPTSMLMTANGQDQRDMDVKPPPSWIECRTVEVKILTSAELFNSASVYKLVDGIKSLPYHYQRLHHLKLPSLAHRRRRGDLILAHKIFSGRVKLDPQKIFGMTTKTLRGHPYRLRKKQITTTLSYNTFSNRIVQDWNRLPKEIVTAQNSQIFKSRIDEWFKDDMYLIPWLNHEWTPTGYIAFLSEIYLLYYLLYWI